MGRWGTLRLELHKGIEIVTKQPIRSGMMEKSLARCQFDQDLRRRQQRVVDETTMYSAHDPRVLVFGEGDRAYDVDFEVAEPGRLHQLISGHRNLDAGFREIAGLQILHGIEGGAGAQGREHQLRRRHPGVIAVIFNRLVALDRVGPRLNGKLYSFKMFDRYLHGSHYLS